MTPVILIHLVELWTSEVVGKRGGGTLGGYCAMSTVLEITRDGACVILTLLLSSDGYSCMDVRRKQGRGGGDGGRGGGDYNQLNRWLNLKRSQKTSRLHLIITWLKVILFFISQVTIQSLKRQVHITRNPSDDFVTLVLTKMFFYLQYCRGINMSGTHWRSWTSRLSITRQKINSRSKFFC